MFGKKSAIASIVAIAASLGTASAVARDFDTFRNKRELLQVNTSSIQYDKSGAKVKFSSVWDMGRKTPGGHRSMLADIRIDCAANTYTMPKVEYYSGPSAGGELLHSEPNNDNPPQDFGTGRDVIAQAARKYCE